MRYFLAAIILTLLASASASADVIDAREMSDSWTTRPGAASSARVPAQPARTEQPRRAQFVNGDDQKAAEPECPKTPAQQFVEPNSRRPQGPPDAWLIWGDRRL